MNVTLRQVVEADLPTFFEQQYDPVAAKMANFPIREREPFMKHWLEKVLPNPKSVVRTIVADGAIAGNVVSWETAEGEWLVGYWLGRAFWGKKIASAAVALFLREVERRPLFAFVAVHNAGSIRVLEKCGFVRVGEEPEELKYRIG